MSQAQAHVPPGRAFDWGTGLYCVWGLVARTACLCRRLVRLVVVRRADATAREDKAARSNALTQRQHRCRDLGSVVRDKLGTHQVHATAAKAQLAHSRCCYTASSTKMKLKLTTSCTQTNSARTRSKPRLQKRIWHTAGIDIPQLNQNETETRNLTHADKLGTQNVHALAA